MASEKQMPQVQNLYQVGGSLSLDSPTYVERQADTDLYESLKQGEFCYILNSRQMGKSSLRVRTMKRLVEEGYACAAVDITAIGTADISPEQWYAGLIDSIVSSLDLYDAFDLEEWWEQHRLISPVQRFGKFLDEGLLKHISTPIVLFIDEIDSILSLSFPVDDFFALIREAFNRRADRLSYRRLTFALFGVATPGDLIRDRQRTPFNIGRAIELRGFQLKETKPLLRGILPKSKNPVAVLKAIIAYTGGQPFLTQKLCKMIFNSQEQVPLNHELIWVNNLVRSQLVENWEAQDQPEHFKTIRDRILWSSENRQGRLLGLYQQIVQSEIYAQNHANYHQQNDDPDATVPKLEAGIIADDSQEQTELRITGLVVKRNGRLKVYNPIYAAIFNQQWVNQALANLRPYSEVFRAWVDSDYQDESRLLRGRALQDALLWASDKNLSNQDYHFFSASQECEKREVELALVAQAEANQILSAAKKRLEQTLVEEQNAKARLVATQQQLHANLMEAEVVLKSAAAKATFILNQHFDSLLESMEAAQQLLDLEISMAARAKLRMYGITALHQAVYNVNEYNRLAAHLDTVTCIAVQVGDRLIATGSSDRTVKIWDNKGNLLQVLMGHTNWITCLSFNSNGQILASGSRDGTIRLWKLNRMTKKFIEQPTQIIKDHQAPILALQFSPTDAILASCGEDIKIRLWRDDGTPFATFAGGHHKWITCLRFSDDGEKIITGSADRSVIIWHINGTPIKNFTADENFIEDLDISPSGKLIATASRGRNINLWNMQGNLVSVLEGHTDKILAVRFHPNGKYLASASSDRSIKLWDLQGNVLHTYRGHKGAVDSLCFSDNGKMIITGSQDTTVKFWRTRGHQLSRLTGHTDEVNSIAFSKDGCFVATASSDAFVKIWTIEGKLLRSLEGHKEAVNSVCFSPDYHNLLSVGGDRAIKIWNTKGNLIKSNVMCN
jgi:WD40 repeat protein